jgi:Type IV secretion-system coupling protein DNA-binding domain
MLRSILSWLKWQFHRCKSFFTGKTAGRAMNSPSELDTTLRWGPLLLPPSLGVLNFLAVGAPGSGKTVVLRLLLQDVMASLKPGSDGRLLIHDAKQDVIPMLAGMSPDVPLIITNPFDRRSAAWEICRDLKEPRTCLEFSVNLIEKDHESQPYFAEAARHLTYAVLCSYLWRDVHFSFADVLRGLWSPKLLRRVLLACPHTKHFVSRYFFDKKTIGSVLSTLDTKTLAFESIAACWETATRKFSLEEFVSNECILILGNSETSRHSIDAINRCLFKRASDLTLNQSESTSRRSWFFVDELSEAGRLPGIVSLLKKGRSKGACVALAFQSIEGLKAPHLYGPAVTADLVGQFGHRFFGRLECPQTATWASELIGQVERREITMSRTFSTQHSVTISESIVMRPTVLPSELLSLPLCDANGLAAFYLCRNQPGVFQATLPGRELFDGDLLPVARDVPGFLPRPSKAQLLRPWTAEEEALFAPKPPKSERPKVRRRSSEELNDLFQDMNDL